ncbi:HEAT repeat domain-containing protein [Candidatus Margulisiibacteriota bacterium]
MNIDINWLIALNFFFLLLIQITISFIILRRIIRIPYIVRTQKRERYYRTMGNAFFSRYLRIKGDVFKTYELFEKLKTYLHVRNKTDRMALEKVIIEFLERVDPEDKNIPVQIYEDSDIVGWRITQLRSRNVWTRRKTADILGKTGSQKAVKPLILAMRDRDENVRYIAARALGKLQATEAIEYLISLFQDLSENKNPVIADVLISFGQSAIPYIVQALDNPNQKTRFWVVRALAELDIETGPDNYPQLIQKLENILANDEPHIKAYSAVCLAKLNSHENISNILALLDNPDPDIRVITAGALGIMKDPEAIDPLIKTLQDKKWEVNLAASQALISYGNVIKDKITANLHHPANIVRKRCREILEEISPQ